MLDSMHQVSLYRWIVEKIGIIARKVINITL